MFFKQFLNNDWRGELVRSQVYLDGPCQRNIHTNVGPNEASARATPLSSHHGFWWHSLLDSQKETWFIWQDRLLQLEFFSSSVRCGSRMDTLTILQLRNPICVLTLWHLSIKAAWTFQQFVPQQLFSGIGPGRPGCPWPCWWFTVTLLKHTGMLGTHVYESLTALSQLSGCFVEYVECYSKKGTKNMRELRGWWQTLTS